MWDSPALSFPVFCCALRGGRHAASAAAVGLLSLCLVFLGLAAPALAQPMDGAAFEAYVQGKTLTFSSQGVPYGVEQYFPGRRVRWAFTDDDCVDGVWYEQGEMICFAYEAEIEPQCWTFELGPRGLIARFRNDPGSIELYEAYQSATPMACLGPKVGV